MARFNVSFSTQAESILAELAREKGMTRAEVIRRALGTFRWYSDTIRDGNRLIVQAPDGSLREVLSIGE